MTLFDTIKEMSVTDLAEFLKKNDGKFIFNADEYICKRCKVIHPTQKCHIDEEACNYGDWSAADLIREWLLQEVTDDGA